MYVHVGTSDCNLKFYPRPLHHFSMDFNATKVSSTSVKIFFNDLQNKIVGYIVLQILKNMHLRVNLFFNYTW